jgi:hypothetical protein
VVFKLHLHREDSVASSLLTKFDDVSLWQIPSEALCLLMSSASTAPEIETRFGIIFAGFVRLDLCEQSA